MPPPKWAGLASEVLERDGVLKEEESDVRSIGEKDFRTAGRVILYVLNGSAYAVCCAAVGLSWLGFWMAAAFTAVGLLFGWEDMPDPTHGDFVFFAALILATKGMQRWKSPF